jgi:hypothetical protein
MTWPTSRIHRAAHVLEGPRLTPPHRDQEDLFVHADIDQGQLGCRLLACADEMMSQMGLGVLGHPAVVAHPSGEDIDVCGQGRCVGDPAAALVASQRRVTRSAYSR